MLIGEMMRGVMRGVVMNDKVTDMKNIELRPGQVVKATVLQTFPNQEAMLSIDGAKIRAKLETPLSVGQVATLQVQNESTPAQIILKPLQVAAEISEDATQEMLRNLAAKDTPANRMLAQQLLSSPVPLSKEAVQQIKQAMAANPPNIPAEEWNQAIVVAHNKGLPMSQDSLRALHQVLFGKPLHESIEQLTRQVQELAARGTMTPQTQQKMDQLLQILQQMKDLSAKITGDEATPKTAQTQAGQANTVITTPRQPGLQQPTTGQVTGNQLAADQSATNTVPGAKLPISGQTTTNQGQTGAQTANNVSGQQANTVNSAQQGLTGQAGLTAPVAPASVPATGMTGTQVSGAQAQGAQLPASQVPSSQVSGTQVASTQVPGVPVQGQAVTGAPGVAQGIPVTGQPQGQVTQGQVTQNQVTQTQAAQNQAATTQAANNAATTRAATGEILGPIRNNWAQSTQNNYVSAGTYSIQSQDGEKQIVQQLLQHMGVKTEHEMGQAARRADLEQATQLARQNMQTLANQLNQQTTQTQAQNANASTFDTLKGTLMQLLAAADMPPAMKGTLETLTQHITGQQLLLSPDKYGSFSYVTMTIPLFDKQDGQTAEVYIQSRKGKKGELDPKNCRLLFDLNMKSIGQTMVDVHVVDRIVNVYIMNDSEEAKTIIEQSRDEIAASMEDIGFQFLSLRVSDYPHDFSESTGSADAHSEAQAVKMPQSNGQNYRGVDFRV